MPTDHSHFGRIHPEPRPARTSNSTFFEPFLLRWTLLSIFSSISLIAIENPWTVQILRWCSYKKLLETGECPLISIATLDLPEGTKSSTKPLHVDFKDVTSHCIGRGFRGSNLRLMQLGWADFCGKPTGYCKFQRNIGIDDYVVILPLPLDQIQWTMTSSDVEFR